MIDFLIIKILGRLNWTGLKYFLTGREYNLLDQDIFGACREISKTRCIGLIRRNTHFTTYLITFGHLLVSCFYPKLRLEKKIGHWSHAFLHVEDIGSTAGFEVIEAVGSGVKKSEFWNVFNADSICLLKPKYIDANEFEKIVSFARSSVGVAYDTSFKMFDKSKMSCVEFVYNAMIGADSESLPNLKKMVEETGKLTPDMIYLCGDFEIVYEVRR